MDRGSSYQVKSWFGSNVAAVAPHPAVRSLAAKWLQIKSERDPILADFWADVDDAFLNNAILFLKGENDYTYLHHGRALQHRIGFSMQGRTLSELRTRVRAQLIEIYDRSAAEFALAYFQSYADFQEDVVLWGRLCLPLRLSAADERVAILLYCHPIEDKAVIYRHVFERSHAGIIIAAPVRNDAGAITDAWVVAQNEQAGRINGAVEHATSDILLRQTPIFARDEIWTHVIGGIASRPGVATLSDQARGRTLNLYAEAVEEYLVLRLTYVSPANEVFTID